MSGLINLLKIAKNFNFGWFWQELLILCEEFNNNINDRKEYVFE
jgi:hypothetical protein